MTPEAWISALILGGLLATFFGYVLPKLSLWLSAKIVLYRCNSQLSNKESK
jgi:hypothetical protein